MKGSIGVQTRLKSIWSGTPLYNRRIMKYFISSLNFSRSKQAQFRLKVIQFHNKYGTKAAIDAFSVSRRTVFRWKKILKNNKGRLENLIPQKKRPKKLRSSHINDHLIVFIRKLREKYNRIGKDKIKPLLDEYCQENNLKLISISTIGRIIKKNNLYFKRVGRTYHNPQSKWAKRKITYKRKVKHSPKTKKSGYIEIDTIVKFIHGIKLYILNAVDISLRFGFSYGYTRLNSKNSTDFLKRLKLVYPIHQGIHKVQTDNGSEFMGEFDRYLKEKGIKHLFIYPRCPKINGFVERANRSLNEEFLEEHQYLALESIDEFNQKLMDYLIWYNTKRVHLGLDNQTPMDYVLKYYPQECQMWWTCTKY